MAPATVPQETPTPKLAGNALTNALPEYHAFGIGFSAISRETFFYELAQRIHSRNPQYVVTPNLDFARLATDEPSFNRAIKGASMRLCDGAILFHLLRLKRRPVPEKLSGSDLTPVILDWAVENKISIYLFGSDEATLQKVKDSYGAAIVGWDAPPFRKNLWEDDELNAPYVSRIRALNPDIVMVALGAPKQELWTEKYHKAAGAPVTLCIGASLDFIGDRARRSPKILSTLCLEWVWRLAMEPRRLWHRYLSDDLFLITHFSKA